MFRHNKQHNDAKTLSRPIREYMHQKFMLSEKYLHELRCFEHEGTVNERQVIRILIFHPHLARNKHVSLRTYMDLEQHREVLLYEGYEDDARGSLYIEENRKKALSPD